MSQLNTPWDISKGLGILGLILGSWYLTSNLGI